MVPRYSLSIFLRLEMTFRHATHVIWKYDKRSTICFACINWCMNKRCGTCCYQCLTNTWTWMGAIRRCYGFQRPVIWFNWTESFEGEVYQISESIWPSNAVAPTSIIRHVIWRKFDLLQSGKFAFMVEWLRCQSSVLEHGWVGRYEVIYVRDLIQLEHYFKG